MYRCRNCEHTFEEPETKSTTYESYYGVSDLFGNSTPMLLDVCPCCGCDEMDEIDVEEEENDNESLGDDLFTIKED